MLKRKTNSLNKEIWKYFLFFTLLNVSILIILQIFLLNNNYKATIKKEFNNISKEIINKKDNKNINNIITNIAEEKNICVTMTDKDKKAIIKPIFNAAGCIRLSKLIDQYQTEFISSNKNKMTYEVKNTVFNNNTLVTGIKLNNNKYVFLNTTLQPIDITAKVIQYQLIIISIVLLILSIIISFFMAKKISKPITEISNSAKELSKGNYNKKITSISNIKELYDLANTLNTTRIELSKTNDLKRDLMANVSHDMKTPLTMIKAYAEMMTDIHKNNPSKREEDGQIIIEEVDRLSILVDDILELSKMQSNIDKLHREDIDIIGLINNIINKFKYLSDSGYIFEFNHNTEELVINVDKKKLEQVIYNLIANAINYVGKDKKIIIDVISNDETIVKVTDHGKGIKKSELDHIWDKYYKSSKKHQRNKIGTGLGLSIVKNVLAKHNCEYGVISKEGKGSTFWFKLKK